jgi:hypothetical protein
LLENFLFLGELYFVKYYLIILGILLYSFSWGRHGRTQANPRRKTQMVSAKSPSAPDIPQSKVRPCAYSGTLKRHEPSLWQWLFFRPNYEYHITDEKGKAIVFLDLSALATGTPLTHFLGKTVTVNGPSSPHNYRGVMIVKAQYIVGSGNS